MRSYSSKLNYNCNRNGTNVLGKWNMLHRSVNYIMNLCSKVKNFNPLEENLKEIKWKDRMIGGITTEFSHVDKELVDPCLSKKTKLFSNKLILSTLTLYRKLVPKNFDFIIVWVYPNFSLFSILSQKLNSLFSMCLQ